MFRKLFAVALTAGVLGTGVANAQDLGSFPVDRIRESPEKDLITTARLTTTCWAGSWKAGRFSDARRASLQQRLALHAAKVRAKIKIMGHSRPLRRLAVPSCNESV